MTVYRELSLRLATSFMILFLASGGSTAAQQTPTSPPQSGPTLSEVRAGTALGRSRVGEQPPTPAIRGPITPVSRPGALAAPVTTIVSGLSQGVRVRGVTGGFEPSKSHPVPYGETPVADSNVKVTLTGPMNAVQFLDTLSLATNWNILASLAVERITLRLWMNEMTPRQALEVLKFHNIFYEYDPETEFLYVMTRDEYIHREHGRIIEYEFVIEYADLSDIETVLSALLSPQGRLIVAPRNSKIFVYDTTDNIEFMRRAVNELDVPRESQAFALGYVNAEALVDSIESLLSERGEIRVDPRSNSLIVSDRRSNREQIAALIDILDRPLEVRSWILNYADPVSIGEQVAALVPEEMGMVTVNESLHQLTVRAIPERLDEIDALIQTWDRKRRQVQIEAYLLTAGRSVARNLGISWSAFGELRGGAFGVQVGNSDPRFTSQPDSGQRLSVGQLPGIVPFIDPITGEVLTDLAGNVLVDGFRGDNLSAVLDYLETTGDVKILAHPRITVQDGEEARFENTTSVPFAQSTADRPISQIDDEGRFTTGFRSISTIEFIDVGTILHVLPRITEDDHILLDVTSEDSTFTVQIVKSADQESTVPQKTQNLATTQVLVRDRETIIIGGLRTSNFSDNVDKIPLLGDIPILGRLFRSTSKDHKHNELLIFITPTIVDETTQPESLRLASVDQDFASTMRYDSKSSFGRAAQWAKRSKSEVQVAVGQGGGILAEGKLLDLDGLEEMLTAIEHPRKKTVILRKHPRAPEEIAIAIGEIAMEAGFKIDYDDSSFPFVPLPASGSD